ncbi:MAG: hypothetical protein HKL98_12565 [Burkholderiales bacterium]|nr:hypothetical protein [Burkholderiales bacterium]
MFQSFAIHPATRIAVWVILVVRAFTAAPRDLLLLALRAAVFLSLAGREIFVRQLSRMRWILFTLFAIYAFSTPGDPLFPLLGMASPTWQGIDSAALQAGRILFAIACLAVLQGCTPREMMLSGIYSLLSPLGALGVKVERIAVRLLLTLRYAEEKGSGSLFERMESAFALEEFPSTTLKIDLYRFGAPDGIAMIALLALISL